MLTTERDVIDIARLSEIRDRVAAIRVEVAEVEATIKRLGTRRSELVYEKAELENEYCAASGYDGLRRGA